MTRRLMIWTLLLTLAAMSYGCGAWRTTKGLYREYVNPSPTVDITRQGDPNDPETKLAKAVAPADEKLDRLLRLLYTQDYYPSDEWLTSQIRDFPWIDGIMTVSTDGEILQKLPEGESLKTVNLQGILNLGPDWGYDFKTLIEQTPLGPQAYIAMPFYKYSAWQGLIIVYFDPRSLIKLSPQADELLLLTPGQTIWQGSYGSEVAPVLTEDWTAILRKNASGELEYPSSGYFWSSRLFGQNKLVYAIRTK